MAKSKAIPCRTCGQLPVDAVPKTHTAAEVGEKIEEDRKRARRDGVNEAIAAVRKLPLKRDGYVDSETEAYGEGYADCQKDAETAIRAEPGVKK